MITLGQKHCIKSQIFKRKSGNAYQSDYLDDKIYTVIDITVRRDQARAQKEKIAHKNRYSLVILELGKEREKSVAYKKKLQPEIE